MLEKASAQFVLFLASKFDKLGMFDEYPHITKASESLGQSITFKGMRYTLIKINNKLSSLIKKSFRQAANLTEDGFNEMSTQFDRLRDKRFCLGITGLSQSGKSTFITSLINQLLEHDNAALAGFSPALGERLLGVKIHPIEDLALSAFAYAESYQRMASATPQWPLSTQNISGCLLELRLSKPQGQLNLLRREQYSL
jgi:hypothetical protein